MGELGFDPTDNYDRKSPAGRKRGLKLDILLTVYEALMEYTISQGADREGLPILMIKSFFFTNKI